MRPTHFRASSLPWRRNRLRPAGEEVRSPKSRNSMVDPVGNGASEVDQLMVQPVIDRGVVAGGRVLDRAHEVLRQANGDCAQREKRRQDRSSVNPERLMNLRE